MRASSSRPLSLVGPPAFIDPFAKKPAASPERPGRSTVRTRTLDTTVPPFTRGPLAHPATIRPPSLVFDTPKDRSPSLRHSPVSDDDFEARQPSPLPPYSQPTLPSEIRDLTAHLERLVTQSNAYVEGLAHRLNQVQKQRDSMDVEASNANLATFLDNHPAFAKLDMERMASFHLPLVVWVQVGMQVLQENPDVEKGLEGVLYWRARAEAEAMGRLHENSRRKSSGSSHTSGSSLLQIGDRRMSEGRIPAGLLSVPEHRPTLLQSHSANAVLTRKGIAHGQTLSSSPPVSSSGYRHA